MDMYLLFDKYYKIAVYMRGDKFIAQRRARIATEFPHMETIKFGLQELVNRGKHTEISIKITRQYISGTLAESENVTVDGIKELMHSFDKCQLHETIDNKAELYPITNDEMIAVLKEKENIKYLFEKFDLI
jgi:hypothetical protein